MGTKMPSGPVLPTAEYPLPFCLLTSLSLRRKGERGPVRKESPSPVVGLVFSDVGGGSPG